MWFNVNASEREITIVSSFIVNHYQTSREILKHQGPEGWVKLNHTDNIHLKSSDRERMRAMSGII